MKNCKIYFLALSFILCALSLTSCNKGIEKRVLDMQQEINLLGDRVEELETQLQDEKTASEESADITDESKDGESTAVTDKTPTLTEYPFESCDKVTTYASQAWFANFKTAFETLYPPKTGTASYPSFDRFGQACYSSVGKSFIAIQSKLEFPNNGFLLFKYDIASEKLTTAQIENYGFRDFVAPDEFGKRHSDSINMFGYGEQNSCKYNSSYSYKYIENKLNLTESCTQCEGQSEACVTY